MSDNIYYNIIKCAGIREGDILDVSSDFSSIYFYFKKQNEKFDANLFIDIIEDVLGPNGTIMIRTFNWDFCHNVMFDINSTPSQVGELGNVCLKRNDYKRTKHPIYSWMVKGHYQNELCEMNNRKSFGKGSPWDFFEKRRAKMLVIGNTQVFGLTCLHHIEQELHMPYRYEKAFTSNYKNEEGIIEKKTYSMYVRRLDRQVIFNGKGSYNRLLIDNIIKENVLDDYLKVASLDYDKTYDVIRTDLENDRIEDWTIIKPLER